MVTAPDGDRLPQGTVLLHRTRHRLLDETAAQLTPATLLQSIQAALPGLLAVTNQSQAGATALLQQLLNMCSTPVITGPVVKVKAFTHLQPLLPILLKEASKYMQQYGKARFVAELVVPDALPPDPSGIRRLTLFPTPTDYLMRMLPMELSAGYLSTYDKLAKGNSSDADAVEAKAPLLLPSDMEPNWDRLTTTFLAVYYRTDWLAQAWELADAASTGGQQRRQLRSGQAPHAPAGMSGPMGQLQLQLQRRALVQSPGAASALAPPPGAAAKGGSGTKTPSSPSAVGGRTAPTVQTRPSPGLQPKSGAPPPASVHPQERKLTPSSGQVAQASTSKKRAPATWTELLQLARAVEGQVIYGTTAHGLCLDLGKNCKAWALLSAVYGSIAQTHGRNQTLWLDPLTLQAAVDNPAMRKALSIVGELAAQSWPQLPPQATPVPGGLLFQVASDLAANVTNTVTGPDSLVAAATASTAAAAAACPVVNQDFADGYCFMTLDWSHAVMFLSTVRGRLGMWQAPGSELVWVRPPPRAHEAAPAPVQVAPAPQANASAAGGNSSTGGGGNRTASVSTRRLQQLGAGGANATTDEGSLQLCTEELCPHAEKPDSAARPGFLVNRAPFTSIANTNPQLAAQLATRDYEMTDHFYRNVYVSTQASLSDLSLKIMGKQDYASVNWTALGLSREDGAALFAGLRSGINHPNAAMDSLAINTAAYRMVLDSAAFAVINAALGQAQALEQQAAAAGAGNGSSSSSSTAAATAILANQVAQQFGTSSLSRAVDDLFTMVALKAFNYTNTTKAFYWRALGYTPETEDGGDGSGSGQNSATQGLQKGVIAGVVVGSVVFAVLAVVLMTWVIIYRYSRHMGLLTGRLLPPGAGPDVTIVATDIQNSTLLWETLPVDVMNSCLSTHHAIIRKALEAHEGYESATEGDAFLVSFHQPAAALAFCIEVQARLLEADWPDELLMLPDGAAVWMLPQHQVLDAFGHGLGGGMYVSTNSHHPPRQARSSTGGVGPGTDNALQHQHQQLHASTRFSFQRYTSRLTSMRSRLFRATSSAVANRGSPAARSSASAVAGSMPDTATSGGGQSMTPVAANAAPTSPAGMFNLRLSLPPHLGGSPTRTHSPRRLPWLRSSESGAGSGRGDAAAAAADGCGMTIVSGEGDGEAGETGRSTAASSVVLVMMESPPPAGGTGAARNRFSSPGGTSPAGSARRRGRGFSLNGAGSISAGGGGAGPGPVAEGTVRNLLLQTKHSGSVSGSGHTSRSGTMPANRQAADQEDGLHTEDDDHDDVSAVEVAAAGSLERAVALAAATLRRGMSSGGGSSTAHSSPSGRHAPLQPSPLQPSPLQPQQSLTPGVRSCATLPRQGTGDAPLPLADSGSTAAPHPFLKASPSLMDGMGGLPAAANIPAVPAPLQPALQSTPLEQILEMRGSVEAPISAGGGGCGDPHFTSGDNTQRMSPNCAPYYLAPQDSDKVRQGRRSGNGVRSTHGGASSGSRLLGLARPAWLPHLTHSHSAASSSSTSNKLLNGLNQLLAAASHSVSGVCSVQEALQQLWLVCPPVEGALDEAPPTPEGGPQPTLVLRGLCVRMGMHSGVSPSEVAVRADSHGRIEYKGAALAHAKAVCDAAAGGMILVSEPTLRAYMLGKAKLPGVQLLAVGSPQAPPAPPPPPMSVHNSLNRNAGLAPVGSGGLGAAAPPPPSRPADVPVAPGEELFCVLDAASLPRLAVMTPFRSTYALGPGCTLLAPLGELTAAFIYVTGLKLLQEWDEALVSRSLDLFHNAMRRSVDEAGGYVVAQGEGLSVVVFGGPATCLNWAVAFHETAMQLDWPPELLEHEYGEEVVANGRLMLRGLRLKTGIDCGTCAARLVPHSGRLDYTGRTMNRASRIASKATQGAVFASLAVWARAQMSEQVGELIGTSQGPIQLKGVRELVELVHVERPQAELEQALALMEDLAASTNASAYSTTTSPLPLGLAPPVSSGGVPPLPTAAPSFNRLASSAVRGGTVMVGNGVNDRLNRIRSALHGPQAGVMSLPGNVPTLGPTPAQLLGGQLLGGFGAASARSAGTSRLGSIPSTAFAGASGAAAAAVAAAAMVGASAAAGGAGANGLGGTSGGGNSHASTEVLLQHAQVALTASEGGASSVTQSGAGSGGGSCSVEGAALAVPAGHAGPGPSPLRQRSGPPTVA